MSARGRKRTLARFKKLDTINVDRPAVAIKSNNPKPEFVQNGEFPAIAIVAKETQSLSWVCKSN